MLICDSHCDHFECNEKRKNCRHLIEDRWFQDWEVDGHKLTIHGKCNLCLMYVPLTITRMKEYQELMAKQPTSEVVE